MKRTPSKIVKYAGAVAANCIGAGVSLAQCTGVWVNSPTGFNGVVHALTSWDPDGGGPAAPVLVAGGDFTNASSVAAQHIAQWSGSAWQSLGSGIGGAFDSVYALASFNNQLFAGGFFAAGGVNSVARWTGSAWQGLGSGVAGQVNAMTVYGNQLIVAGSFSSAGGTTVQNIAAWNGTTWSALGTGIGGDVYALAVLGNDLYAAGFFSSAGGNPANNIARWNGSSWSAVGSGLNDTVNALAVYNNQLHAGGFHNILANAGVARWTGAVWQPLGVGVDNTVHALAAYNGELLVGGRFQSAGGSPANYIARWNGTAWNNLGSAGIGGSGNPDVRALTVHAGLLTMGGDFTTANGAGALRWARWGCQACYPNCDSSTVAPVLNVNDFICFQSKFAAGDTYANCDGSTTAPILNVNDFICFQASFAAGCP